MSNQPKANSFVDLYESLAVSLLVAEEQAEICHEALQLVPESARQAMKRQWILCVTLNTLIALGIKRDILSHETLLETTIKHLGPDMAATSEKILTYYTKVIDKWDAEVPKFEYQPPKKD